MNNNNFGVQAYGIKCPIIREGDNIVKVVVDTVMNNIEDVKDNDIIGVTESVVARSKGLYVTVDEIADDVRKKLDGATNVVLVHPIYSRNRFSMILKGIARATEMVTIYMPEHDEVGNPNGVNPFTGVNIMDYYREIVENEYCDCEIIDLPYDAYIDSHATEEDELVIYCGLHDYADKKMYVAEHQKYCTLADICSDKNPDFGVLGSNKSTEEKLKLFPTRKMADDVCGNIAKEILMHTGKHIYVACYGDGCFHSLTGGIYECADPTTCPGTSDNEFFDSTPNEIKIKAFADDKFSELNGEELDSAIKKEIKEKGDSLVGNMNAQGTTPRLYKDLLASLMDLVSGSGDKGTPIVYISGYLNNYAD